MGQVRADQSRLDAHSIVRAAAENERKSMPLLHLVIGEKRVYGRRGLFDRWWAGDLVTLIGYHDAQRHCKKGLVTHVDWRRVKRHRRGVEDQAVRNLSNAVIV